MIATNLLGQSLEEVVNKNNVVEFGRKNKYFEEIDNMADLYKTSLMFVVNRERENIIRQMVEKKFDLRKVNFARFRQEIKDKLWLIWRNGWQLGENNADNMSFFSTEENNNIAEFTANDVQKILSNIRKSLKNPNTSSTELQQNLQLLEILSETNKDDKNTLLKIQPLIKQHNQLLSGNILDLGKKVKQSAKITPYKPSEEIVENIHSVINPDLEKKIKTLEEKIKKSPNRLDLKQQLKKLKESANNQSTNAVAQTRDTVSLNTRKTTSLPSNILETREKYNRRQHSVKKRFEQLSTRGELPQNSSRARINKLIERKQAEIKTIEDQLTNNTQTISPKTKTFDNNYVRQLSKKPTEQLTNSEKIFLADVKSLNTDYKYGIKKSGLNKDEFNARYRDIVNKNGVDYTKLSDKEFDKLIESLPDDEYDIISTKRGYVRGLRSAKQAHGKTTTSGTNEVSVRDRQKRLERLKAEVRNLKARETFDKITQATEKAKQENAKQTVKNIDSGVNYYLDQSDFGRIYLEKRLDYIAQNFEGKEKQHILKRMLLVFDLSSSRDENENADKIEFDANNNLRNKKAQTLIQQYFEKNKLTYYPQLRETKIDDQIIAEEDRQKYGYGGRRNLFNDKGSLKKDNLPKIKGKLNEQQLIKYYRDVIYGDAPRTAQEILDRTPDKYFIDDPSTGRRVRKVKDSSRVEVDDGWELDLPLAMSEEERDALGLVGKESITIGTLKNYAGRTTPKSVLGKLDANNENIEISREEAKKLGITPGKIKASKLKTFMRESQLDYFSNKAGLVVRTELSAAHHLGRLSHIVENDPYGLVKWVVDKEHAGRGVVCDKLNKREPRIENKAIYHGLGCWGRARGGSAGIEKTQSGIYRAVDVMTEPSLMIPLHPNCQCMIRPLTSDEMRGILGSKQVTPEALAGIGAGAITAEGLRQANREAILNEENEKGINWKAFLTTAAAVALGTGLMYGMYRIALSQKLTAKKIIQTPIEDLEIKYPPVPGEEVKRQLAQSDVLNDALKMTDAEAAQDLVQIPLPELRQPIREGIDLRQKELVLRDKQATEMLYATSHFDELTPQQQRAVLNEVIPKVQESDLGYEFKPLGKKEREIGDTVQEALDQQARLKRRLDIRVAPNPDEIIDVFDKIHSNRTVNIGGKEIDAYTYAKQLDKDILRVAADLPKPSDISRQKYNYSKRKLLELQEQIQELDLELARIIDLPNRENINVDSYFQTLASDIRQIKNNDVNALLNVPDRGFLRTVSNRQKINQYLAQLEKMTEDYKYVKKIKQPSYQSLYRPEPRPKDSRRKGGEDLFLPARSSTNVLSNIDGMTTRKDFTDGIMTMIERLGENDQSVVSKQQVNYIANKYKLSGLQDYVNSGRKNLNNDEINILIEGLKKEKFRIDISEFAQYQKKWAMFGAPK